ncbi:MAG: hypothetical protein JNM94_14750 [Phycisphaerae bacterium]|nr:hypothetical protein [Phycisphaerae bacterium]
MTDRNDFLSPEGGDDATPRRRRSRRLPPRGTPGRPSARRESEPASLDRLLDALGDELGSSASDVAKTSDELTARVMKELGYEPTTRRHALLERAGRWARRSVSLLVFCGVLGVGCWWVDAHQRSLGREAGIGAIDDVVRASLERNREAVGEVVDGMAPLARFAPLAPFGRSATEGASGSSAQPISDLQTYPGGKTKRREAKAPFRSA